MLRYFGYDQFSVCCYERKPYMKWEEHKENFKLLAASTGMTIAEYAAQHGLNPNTARRYLRSNEVQPAGQKKTVKLSSDQAHDQRNDQPAKATKKPANKSSNKTESAEKASKSTARGKRGKKAVAVPTMELMGKVIAEVRDQVPKYNSPDALADAGLVDPNAFLLPTPEDMEGARRLLEEAGADRIEMLMIEKTLAHMLLIERGRAQIIQLYGEMKSQGEDEGTPPIMKLMGVFLSASGAIADLSRTMAQLRQSYRKEQRDQEKHDQKLGEPAIIKRAYSKKKSEGWSAQETAEYIEMNGAKVPPFLLELVRAELKAPPAADDAPAAMSPEELERQSRERQAASMAQLDKWIAEKKQAVAEMVDSLGVGDIDEDGNLDAELAAPFVNGEEPDEELNESLYGAGEYDDVRGADFDGA